MKQLNYDEKATAINEAMRFESEGFSDYEFLKHRLKLELARNKTQYMSFLKSGTPMMQKMYLELCTRKPITAIKQICAGIMRAIVRIAVMGVVTVIMAQVFAEWIGG